MFCARCGEQIPDATVICPLCGRETTVPLQPSPAFPSATAASRGLQAAQVVLEGPQGVGGWLLFFCIVLTILSPLLLTGMFVSLGSRLNRGYLIDLIRIVYGMVTGIVLWTRRPQALIMLRIYFGLVGITALLGILGLILIGIRTGGNAVLLAGRLTPVLQLIGYTIIWFAYFHKSKRVRNTYGANL